MPQSCWTRERRLTQAKPRIARLKRVWTEEDEYAELMRKIRRNCMRSLGFTDSEPYGLVFTNNGVPG